MKMNARLNAVIREEVGVDDGRFMDLEQDTHFDFDEADI